MSESKSDERLRQQLKRQSARMKKAEQEQSTLLAQTVYIGTLGLLFILPVVGGVWLGMWLDEMASYYSIHWTIGLLLGGLVIGALNVYLFIRTHT